MKRHIADYALGGSDPGRVLGRRRSPGYGLPAVAAGGWPLVVVANRVVRARSVPPALVKRPRRACSTRLVTR